MKFLNFLSLSAITALTITSCSNEAQLESNDLQTLEVVPSISVSRSGITASAFTSGETIGLYIYRGDGITSAAEYSDQSGAATKNVPYVQASPNWTAVNKILLSNVVGKVYAYYPYSSTNDSNDGKTISITVSEDQNTGQSDGVKDNNNQTDWMWATPIENVSNKTTSIAPKFNHALSKLTFKFVNSTSDGYTGIGKVTSIVLKNADEKSVVKTKNATMNIGTGVLDMTSAVAGSITLSGITTATLMDETSASLTPSMLVYPMTLTAGDAQIVITLDNEVYTLPVPAQTYEAGKNYVYTFTLKGTGIDPSDPNAFKVTIQPWTEVPVAGGDIVTPDA